jgi:effector-binding domain-containing protein
MSDVSIVKLEPSYMAAVRRRTTFAELPRQIRGYFDIVYAQVRAGQVTKGGHNVALYRNASDNGVDVECGVQVPAKFADIGEVECREIPGGEVATTAHWGPYDRLGEAYDRLIPWIRKNGRTLAGVNWEVYGDWSDDPAKVRTDIHHLLKPRG